MSTLACNRALSRIADRVDDSLLLSGSQAYAAALAYYQSVKAAAKLGQPGAAVIADDLSERFPGRPTKASLMRAADGNGLAQTAATA